MITLYNENCLNTLNRISDNFIDLIITSPPYFNAKDYSQYQSVKDYMNQMKEIFTIAFDKLKLSRMCVVNISPVLIKRLSRNKQSYRIHSILYQ
jgi:DNA modification methylase